MINKNGARLTVTTDLAKFTTDKEQPSNLRFTAKTNNELHNWLVDWHPSKVNETKKHEGNTYAGLEFKHDEKDPSIRIAYDSGKLITNSWIKSQDYHYYADSSGILLKGWKEIEGNTYYFHPESNQRIQGIGSFDAFIDGKYHYFNDAGILQKSAWNGLEYTDASGAFIEEGLKEIDNKFYYFKDYKATTNELRLEDQNIILHFSDKGVLEKASRLDGKELSDIGTYVNFDGKKLVFEKDGSIRKNGVSKIILPDLFNNTREKPLLVYYSLEEGPFYTGWKEINGKKYYFESGHNYNFDFTRTIDGKKYYFNQEGAVLPTGFIDIDGIPYYLNDKSEKVTGIHNIDGKLYLFSKGDNLRAYGEKVRNTIYSWSGNKYYTDHTGVISQNYKGYVDSHNREYYIETNNEGVITEMWKR
ncbi:TPA: hypothetical protein ROX98_003894 [Bacillus pseudomycoides]|nr:hypothetical protein [Bacillus pseudomycoides]